MTWADDANLPVLNLALGVVGLSWLIVRSWQRWQEYPDEVQIVVVWIMGMFLCLLAVSITTYREHPNYLGVNTYLISIIKLSTLYVLWRTRHTRYMTEDRRYEV